MVSIKSLLALLAVQAMTAAAAPAPVSDDPAMELMAQASIYFCSDIRWNGECRNHLIDLDKCSKHRSPPISPIRRIFSAGHLFAPRNETADMQTADFYFPANVPSGWNDRISSIRNDSKSFYTCTWYLDAGCRGQSYANQEDANLADGNGRFNDSISSYSCKRK
ncbi:hypothetical protein CPLU01_10829 [Colletotrichum plurivorum]|uniref:Uncharacterized protein n=1 Tax=Colletotrichum plurivorum TaxID=2175906 RepID=A0A8H6K3Q3_9PEZI|nr:hypothetical protein CPLU01_10829 [Colletotrichum plurivorum]